MTRVASALSVVELDKHKTPKTYQNPTRGCDAATPTRITLRYALAAMRLAFGRGGGEPSHFSVRREFLSPCPGAR